MLNESTAKGVRDVFRNGRELIDASGGELIITMHGPKWVVSWTVQPGFWLPQAVARHEDLDMALNMLAQQLKLQSEMLLKASQT